MRTTAAPFALLVITSFACATEGEPTEPFCELDGTAPSSDDVADGTGRASQDGETFAEEGSYNALTVDITIGLLSIIADRTDDGTRVRELIENGDFPVCVTIAARSEESGQANFVEGGFVTDDDHAGTVALLEIADDLLVGRFAFSLANPGGDEMSFTDGMFRVPARE